MGAFIFVSAVATFFYVEALVLVATTPLAVSFDLLGRWFVIALVLLLAYLDTPLGAFGSLAAIVFAIGWYLPWSQVIAVRPRWVRGAALLAVVLVLHGIWFQFSWVPFQPPCIGGYDPIYGGAKSLEGPLKPEAAARIVAALQRQYSDNAARLSGTGRVLVRPAIGLLPSDIHWNYTSRIADDMGGARGSDGCREVERSLMAGGQARSRGVGWGYWPWNTLGDGIVARWLRGFFQDG